jgi:CheY-like chemotaxis protein
MDRLQGALIIIVDDDDDLRDSVRDVLALFGAEAVGAATCAEALTLLALVDADLVVCDWDLGGGDRGDTVLAAARQLAPYAARVLLTGSSREQWLHVVAAGLAAVVITKPFELPELRAALGRALAAASRRDGRRCCQDGR